jgi:hypothetical protein
MNFLKRSNPMLLFFFTLILGMTLSSCTPWNCGKKPREYASLIFQLRDKNTGLPLIAAPGSFITAPDSIQLKNINTNAVYILKMGSGAYKEALFHAQDYQGKKGSVDKLEFRFGSSKDTLTITIGTIKGWRGDECGSVDDPGIIEVKQNGTTIYSYQPNKDSAFVIKK